MLNFTELEIHFQTVDTESFEFVLHDSFSSTQMSCLTSQVEARSREFRINPADRSRTWDKYRESESPEVGL